MRRLRAAGRKACRIWQPALFAFSLLFHLVTVGVVDGALAFHDGAPGTVICSVLGGGVHPGTPVAPTGDHHLPDCCLAGCPVASGGPVVAVPADLVLPMALRPPVGVFAVGALSVLPAEHQPWRPRGPPTMNPA